jgi:dihydroflavonol-4-reductase
MSTVLVTGASGFIGSHLWETLVQQGFHVRCLVRNASQAERCRAGGAEPVLGDATDLESVRQAVLGADLVFNLAGLTHARTTAELVRVNQGGPEQIARACAEQESPPCHILVSSVAAAGPTTPDRIRTEADPPAPVSHYGRSKLLGEQAVRRWAAEVPTTIIRPGVVFGPRDRGMVPVMDSIARFRLHFNPGWNSPLLSFIDVFDLLLILQMAAEKGERLPAQFDSESNPHSQGMGDVKREAKAEPELDPESDPESESESESRTETMAEGKSNLGQGIYFGVSPERLRYAELGNVLGAVFHPRGRVLTLNLPPAVAWTVGGASQWWAGLRGKSDLLNLDKIREAMVPSWGCSSEKIEQQLGFRPAQPLTLQLQETARWYQTRRT